MSARGPRHRRTPQRNRRTGGGAATPERSGGSAPGRRRTAAAAPRTVRPPVAVRLRSTSQAQTRRIGRQLGRLLRAGDCVALSGPLGAGKTVLVQGIAEGLDVPPDEPVVSPTFVLVRQYSGRVPLYHVDAYRLRGADELWDIGVEELLTQGDGVVVIEWADRVPQLIPPGALRVELEHLGPQSRRVTIRCAQAQRIAGLRNAGRRPTARLRSGARRHHGRDARTTHPGKPGQEQSGHGQSGNR